MYPTGEEYVNAVRNIDICVLDPSFKGGQARKKGFLLEQYAGGYTRVFPITVGNKTLALRGFTSDVKDAKYRYQVISKYLANQSQFNCFVDFEYIETGIRIKGKIFPIIRMEWFEGVTLKLFLQKNRTNTYLVRQTAQIFLNMVQTLHQHGMSHGDLQEENILVKNTGNNIEMKLIDYDSLYVPSLKKCTQQIVGKPNFQHPKRIRNESKNVCDNEKVDYFSELVIYICLIGLAEKPDLWDKYNVNLNEGLLFEPGDFIAPQKSKILRDLKNISPDLQHFCQTLEQFCRSSDLNQLVPLEALVLQTGIPKPMQPIQIHPNNQKISIKKLAITLSVLIVVVIIVAIFYVYFTDPNKHAVSPVSEQTINESIQPDRNIQTHPKPYLKQTITKSTKNVMPSETEKESLNGFTSDKNRQYHNQKQQLHTTGRVRSSVSNRQQHLLQEKQSSCLPETPIEIDKSIRPFHPKIIASAHSSQEVHSLKSDRLDEKQASTNKVSEIIENRILSAEHIIFSQKDKQPLIKMEGNQTILVSVIKYLNPEKTKANVKFSAFTKGFSVDDINLLLQQNMKIYSEPNTNNAIGRLCTNHTFRILHQHRQSWYRIEIPGSVVLGK
jgi:serine/threonine protein kinase